MPGHDYRRSGKILTALGLLLLCAGDASAYVGPGANLQLVAGFTLPLLGFFATAFSAMFLWPVYSFIRRLRGIKDTPTPPVAETTRSASVTAAPREESAQANG